MELKKEIAIILKDEMDNQNLTITDLSRKSGLARPSIAEILKGNTDIKLSTLMMLCVALNIKASKIISEFENEKVEHKTIRNEPKSIDELTSDDYLLDKLILNAKVNKSVWCR